MTSRQEAPASVLVITHFHAPEPCAAANRVAALTRALAEARFDVEVLTGFANFPDGVVAASDRLLFRTETVGERIRLVRVATYASPNISGRSRLLNWFSVAVAMTARIFSDNRSFDAVIVTIPPVTLTIPFVAAMLKYRAKMIVDVRDVFPDVAIKMGYWRPGSAVAKIVGRLMAFIYGRSDLVLCVTDAARTEIIDRGADPSKVMLASNGFDPIEVAVKSPYDSGSQQFVVTFIGNMGLATGLDAIIDAAEYLRNDIKIHFVLAGGGVEKERLLLRIANQRLSNVTMLGVITRPQANALLSASAVSVVPLHPGIVDSLPTKMFDSLVLGCPVVCCANGEASTFISRSRGGVVVPPNDGAALARALQELQADPERCAAYAVAGREYVLSHYDRSKIMRAVTSRLRELLRKGYGG